MRPVVHIFFNACGVVLPERNEWDRFGEVDSLRLFLICAESWERHGWEVRRLSTVQGDFPATLFNPEGIVQRQFHWYAEELWQFVAKARSVAEAGINVFSTFDVINTGFMPSALRLLEFEGGECYSFQKEHFSLSCFACTREYLEKAEETLLRYDRGELPEIRGDYVSDETILRHYSPGKIMGWQKFACNPGSERLVHFARSTLARSFRDLPLSHHATQEKSRY